VLAFTGNNLTPCTHSVDGSPLEGAALVDRYGVDVEAEANVGLAAGATVFIVEPPAMLSDDALRQQFAARYQEVAGHLMGSWLVDGGALLTPNGFRFTAPCLPQETAAMGCVDGLIPIRAADGGHLAPPVPVRGTGTTYSSGAWRYAAAMIGPVQLAGG